MSSRSLNSNDIALPTVLYALSDPIRLEIARELAATTEESCGGFGIEVAKSTLSHHFKALREAGIMRTRVEGTRCFVYLPRVESSL